MIRDLTKRTTTIRITADTVSIGSGLFPQTYNRSAPHFFAVTEEHDKARIERERHEFEDRKDWMQGRIKRRKRYYQESRHVILRWLGQRIDIADVYGVKKAMTLRDRLDGANQVVEGLSCSGEGVVIDPAAERPNQPGRIPV